MTPRNRKRLTIALGVAGFAALLYYFGNRKGSLAGFRGLGLFTPKYRYVAGQQKPAPLVGVTERNGMRTELRSSATMPIEERIGSIQDLVFKGVQDPTMRKLALQITKDCPERDGTCEAQAIYDYMKKHVRYTGDIGEVAFGRNGPVEGIDLYQSGKRTLEFGGGDCDDHSGLGATLLALNGITPRLRVTAESRNADDSHIYVGAMLPKTNPKKFVALDTTLPGDDQFGVELPSGRVTDFDG